MNETEVTKVCSKCGAVKSIQSFRPEGCARTRRICGDCIALREAVMAGPKWDWAKALNKEAAMHAEHVKHHKTLYSSTLTSNILRALMQLQNNRCAFTDEIFHLPSDNELKINETLTMWRKKLPPDKADRTPVLVRVDSSEPWEAGNVFFISNRWQAVYESYNNINDFRNSIAQMNNIKIPSKEAIIAKRLT